MIKRHHTLIVKLTQNTRICIYFYSTVNMQTPLYNFSYNINSNSRGRQTMQKQKQTQNAEVHAADILWKRNYKNKEDNKDEIRNY